MKNRVSRRRALWVLYLFVMIPFASSGCTPQSTSPPDPAISDYLLGSYHGALISWSPKPFAGYTTLCPTDSILLSLNSDGTFSVRITLFLSSNQGFVDRDTLVRFLHQGTFTIPRPQYNRISGFEGISYWTGSISFSSDDGFKWSADFKVREIRDELEIVDIFFVILDNFHGTVVSQSWWRSSLLSAGC